jgi:undecaprenyl-diphosphatase
LTAAKSRGGRPRLQKRRDNTPTVSYLQAIVIALVQGATELFPVSSLGHSVLVPAWIGGSWNTLVTQSAQANSESSFYLAFIVALHVGTALALLWFFRADWIRIVTGFVRSVRRSVSERQFTVRGSDERLAWLIVLATIPVGLTGLLFEHSFRTVFAKPVAASVFLFINGLILLAGERARRRMAPADGGRGTRPVQVPIAGGSPEADGELDPRALHAARRGARSVDELAAAYQSDARIARISYRDGLFVGATQILALFAGISRSGVTMVGGLWRGLDHEDAARFAFLLATPVILAAGVLKLPSLAGHAGAHIHGQVAVGFVVTGVTAYISIRYLVRYFQTRTLRPFAIYCLVVGFASAVRFAAF